MLILNGNTDYLQVATGGAGAVDVHVSWMDNVAGAVNPGRTNTSITAATVTNVCSPPAAGAFRNIKTVHVRNKSASTITVTLRHFDNVTPYELYTVALATNTSLQYIDEIGFIAPPPPPPAPPPPPINRVAVQKFLSNSTYVPSAGMLYAFLECVGGGGGGGMGYSNVGMYMIGGGGGSGGYSRALVTKAAIGAGQGVIVGAGGSGGFEGSGDGQPGGATQIGGFCLAYGGSGGGMTAFDPATNGLGGAGGVPGIGDIAAAGAPGDGGFFNLVNYLIGCRSGLGGSSIWGGGAPGSNAGQGFNGNSYGSGGSGGTAANALVAYHGGTGSPGIAVVTELLTG